MKKILVLFLSLSFLAFSETLTITYRAPESKNDTRFDYPLELIKTAMEKTKKNYGDYELIPSPNMNFQRASEPRYISTLNNFIFETAVTKENDKNLLPIKIPIAKGLYGYRIFLINKNNQDLFNKINSLEDLKEKISIGQGRTWPDVKILESHDFKVIKGSSYEGLFYMVVQNKFEAYSRGVNEAFHEYKDRVNKLSQLAVEKNLCLYYPLPRYFYTAKNNLLLAKRLEKGLNIMLDDGSFDKIWKKYHSVFLKDGDLANRKIFKITNPTLPSDVPFDNEKLWYVPGK